MNQKHLNFRHIKWDIKWGSPYFMCPPHPGNKDSLICSSFCLVFRSAHLLVLLLYSQLIFSHMNEYSSLLQCNSKSRARYAWIFPEKGPAPISLFKRVKFYWKVFYLPKPVWLERNKRYSEYIK